jgi:hypothetical protein
MPVLSVLESHLPSPSNVGGSHPRGDRLGGRHDSCDSGGRNEVVPTPEACFHNVLGDQAMSVTCVIDAASGAEITDLRTDPAGIHSFLNPQHV